MEKEKFEQFCPECGRALIRTPIPAEKAKIVSYDWGDMNTYILGDRFNKYTGLRQFGIRVLCLNKRWYNHHTDYVDENSLHDSDLPELIAL